ncbi:hypothetical protein [Legionella hackeliae]|uniref:Tryptophan synthase subunit beta like protein n=1 Tax=Legionella hackeliae TaxID=449 RepID=A0A0A8UQS1_LEGHA|nr:hypothetical protein [Legionella hackeliae]KTD09610.1 hypothetical protein Lhac_1978 [Legionella hackeliae]CEK11073.1 conserved protein of unknown function [Legionella hackeliae]STX47820.1 Uncharacterised protein [Legionella hackeliae]
MVYIKRDNEGKICALYETGSAEMEALDMHHPEVLQFLARCDSEKQWELLQSDLKLIRVLEDLIDVLISKNLIRITDFPQPVIDKLLSRQSIRKRLSGAIGMEFDNET